MSLVVSGLCKNYGAQKALDDVSFEAVRGSVLGFLGPNGAGKSTTMKIITGSLGADAGEVRVLGLDALSFPKKASPLIGYLPEKNPLYPDMYVWEFLSFAGGLYGLKGKNLKDRIAQMIAQTGLEPEQHKKIGQLSKGYQQRVGLAKALIHDPEVLLLDEPTTGLDPNQLADIRRLIGELSKDKIVILSTHIMQEVASICQEVVLISGGKIRLMDSLENFQKKGNENRLVLEVEEPVELGWFESFGDVEYGPKGTCQVLIRTEQPKDSRKVLLQIVRQRGLNLVSLTQAQSRLEDLFRQYTR